MNIITHIQEVPEKIWIFVKASKFQFDRSCPDCKEVYNLSGRAHCIGFRHRLENRCVLRHISNMNFQSWTSFGQSGMQRKNIQTAISTYATFEASFLKFSCAKNIELLIKSLLATTVVSGGFNW